MIVLCKHYETILNEAKVRRETSLSKRKEEADSGIRKIQDDIEKTVKETKVIASVSYVRLKALEIEYL